MSDAKYDPTEALSLLHGFAEKLDPDRSGRRKAGLALLDALVALNGQTRVRVAKTEDGDVLLSLFSRRAWAAVDSEGNVLVGADPFMREANEVPLHFNPATGLLESTKDDEERAPEPGKRRAKRSALAEVVEAALALLQPPG